MPADLPFKRIYVDIPADTHALLVEKAREAGVPQKKFMADLITEACTPAGKKSRKR